MVFFEQDNVNQFVKINSMTNALVDCCVVFLHISLHIDHDDCNVSEMFHLLLT